MRRVLTVIGARPQFIKASAVSRALAAHPGVQEILVHTGQHYDAGMSEVFFEELGIPRPHHNLGVGSGPHGAQTGRMLAAVEELIAGELPDWVLVYGDTNSTLAGALAAAKLHVPVAHVEAGLRSYNRRMPEEINRVLTDHASDLLFTPTGQATLNLAGEGIGGDRVREVGDVMLDVALEQRRRAASRRTVLDGLELRAQRFALATFHRAENTDDPARISAITRALVRLARELPVVLPLHPRTAAALEEHGLRSALEAALTVIAPVGYLDMVALEQAASLILTDSGGVQKEAFFHRVPCVTARTETEWTELVEAGWNHLADPSSDESILTACHAALGTAGRQDFAPYGDGRAAAHIAAALAA